MDLPFAKVLSAIILLLLTFITSMLPLCLFRPLSLYDPPSRHTIRKRIMSFLSCFAGGVFLGTCLLHLFPDVGQQVDLVMNLLKMTPGFPVTEFLVGFGFLTILIVEQITLDCQRNSVEEVDQSSEDTEETQPLNQSLIPDIETEDNSNYVSTTYGAIQGVNEQSEYNIRFQQDRSHSIFHSLLLLLALSMHSVFEGLAIGLQTTIRDDLRILLAVSIHKCILAFSLGLKLTHSGMGVIDTFKSNLFFSLTSPVGILFGLAVMNLVTGIRMLITSAILQGLATGTFLYITLFEVLPKEFTDGRDPDRMLKVVSVVIGFSVVCILIIFLPD